MTIGYGQRNNIYAELGGAGYSTTINYERLFIDKILIRMGYVVSPTSNGGHGWIAQLVEQRTENPCVAGSNPALATILSP